MVWYLRSLEIWKGVVKEVDLKIEKMRPQELKVIEYHLVKGESVKRAINLGGYQYEVEGTLYFWARKILEKLEENTEDHQKIMQAVGAACA
jgi:hypothetical protein